MIYLSVCSRSGKKPKSLQRLVEYCNTDSSFLTIRVAYDSSSIYEGHKENIKFFKTLNLQDEDIIVLCHDDIDILSKPEDLLHYLSFARKPGVGFLGLAGSCYLPTDGAWWNARKNGRARGFIFQGVNHQTMTPNYFGKSGQVVFLDGCFLAITYENLKKVGLEQPEYLDSGWDFYDIHLTHKAHLDGFSNYVVPIIAMHESPGIMRDGWHLANRKFLREHGNILQYSAVPVDKTHGLPWNT